MFIPDFNFHKPNSLNEAFHILGKSDDGAILAGGTDLLVEIKKGLRFHKDIVSLTGIKQLNYVKIDETSISIGAATTLNEIISSPIIKKYYSSFARALLQIGTEQVRNLATIGGNLCSGASCGDSAPILMAFDAGVFIANIGGEKTVSLRDIFIRNKRTILKRGEIMTKVVLPLPQDGLGAHYEKFGLREAVNICVASAAVMVKTTENRCIDACVVLGAVAPTPIFIQKSGNLLKGKDLSELVAGSVVLEQAGQVASDESVPIDDIRGSAKFRKEILKVITKRAILKAIECSRQGKNS